MKLEEELFLLQGWRKDHCVQRHGHGVVAKKKTKAGREKALQCPLI